MMDHDSIVKNNIAERYLLRELTEAESDAFEEHYFDCQQCAERIRCGTELMEYGREVVREDARNDSHNVEPFPVHPHANRRTSALHIGMLVLLMIGVGVPVYQRFFAKTPPQQVASSAAPAQQARFRNHLIRLDSSRGESNVSVLGGDERPELTFAIASPNTSPKPSSYQAVLSFPSGKRLTREITTQEADEQIDWPIEGNGLTSGRYSVSFRPLDKDGAELKADMKTLWFSLELQNK